MENLIYRFLQERYTRNKNYRSLSKHTMKQLKFFIPIISISICVFSCNGNSSNTPAKNKSATASSSDNSSSTLKDDGSFSYKIDGREISGGGQDPIHAANSIHFQSKDTIYFVLLDQSGKSTSTPQFSFRVAANGTTEINQDDMDRHSSGNNVTYFAEFNAYPKDNIPNYSFHSGITVNITSNNGSRVTGTFSGQMEDDANKIVQLTDGKFELPVAPK
jgi:hypothetical protein